MIHNYDNWYEEVRPGDLVYQNDQNDRSKTINLRLVVSVIKDDELVEITYKEILSWNRMSERIVISLYRRSCGDDEVYSKYNVISMKNENARTG